VLARDEATQSKILALALAEDTPGDAAPPRPS
jgi:hypothetical protein